MSVRACTRGRTVAHDFVSTRVHVQGHVLARNLSAPKHPSELQHGSPLALQQPELVVAPAGYSLNATMPASLALTTSSGGVLSVK